MSNIPEAVFYLKDHEWISVHDDGTALICSADYAQESLGYITFEEFPAVIEPVKATSDLFMLLDAEEIETNGDVEADPKLLNSDPYQKDWLLKIRISKASHVDGLIQAEAYSQLV